MKNWKVKSTKLVKGQYLDYRIRAHNINIDANGLLEFYDMGIVVSSFSSDEWFICYQTNVFGYTKKSHCNPFQFAHCKQLKEIEEARQDIVTNSPLALFIKNRKCRPNPVGRKPNF